jgi:ankyrin repeat protein
MSETPISDTLMQALKIGDLPRIRAQVKAEPEAARHARYLNRAAQSASLQALKLLHRAGVDWNAPFRNYRPLHNVLQENPHAGPKAQADPARVECLEWLLDHGADPELLAGWPPARAVVTAAFVGQKEYVKILRKHGARVDGFAAAALGNLKLLAKTLAADAGFAHARDHGTLTALQCAAGSRMPRAKVLEAAAMLIDAGADVKAKTKSWGHLPVFRLLLERGADATEALTPALWNGTLEFAALALEHGAVPDRAIAERKPLLNHLICWGQIPQTMWLLEHGASPNIADVENGWTAAHQAASRGNARMMRAVLDRGADITRRDLKGSTPLDVARAAGREKLAAMMLAIPPERA